MAHCCAMRVWHVDCPFARRKESALPNQNMPNHNEHGASPRVSASAAIRPFHVNVPETDLTELRRRINATKWPERETVADESQGVPLAIMQDLARHWAKDYDWRACEAKLNALP